MRSKKIAGIILFTFIIVALNWTGIARVFLGMTTEWEDPNRELVWYVYELLQWSCLFFVVGYVHWILPWDWHFLKFYSGGLFLGLFPDVLDCLFDVPTRSPLPELITLSLAMCYAIFTYYRYWYPESIVEDLTGCEAVLIDTPPVSPLQFWLGSVRYRTRAGKRMLWYNGYLYFFNKDTGLLERKKQDLTCREGQVLRKSQMTSIDLLRLQKSVGEFWNLWNNNCLSRFK